MKKTWKVDGASTKYETYEEALDTAKRRAANGVEAYGIYELVAYAKSKTPDVDVTTVTA